MNTNTRQERRRLLHELLKQQRGPTLETLNNVGRPARTRTTRNPSGSYAVGYEENKNETGRH